MAAHHQPAREFRHCHTVFVKALLNYSKMPLPFRQCKMFLPSTHVLTGCVLAN